MSACGDQFFPKPRSFSLTRIFLGLRLNFFFGNAYDRYARQMYCILKFKKTEIFIKSLLKWADVYPPGKEKKKDPRTRQSKY